MDHGHVCYFRTVLKTETQFRWDKEKKKKRKKKDTLKLPGVRQNSHISRRRKRKKKKRGVKNYRKEVVMN